MSNAKEGASKENYSQNFFSLKNILIYVVVAIVVYGLVYYLFVVKQGGYNPNNYITPTGTPTVTVTETPVASPSGAVIKK